MSLTSATALKTLDTAFQGQPFVSITSKPSLSNVSVNMAFQGQPFYSNPAPSGPGPGGAQQFQLILGM